MRARDLRCAWSARARAGAERTTGFGRAGVAPCPSIAGVEAASPPRPTSFDQLEDHRRELTAYCYRMLGSPFEAEDAVQDTLVRAWRALDRFEGRSSVKS